MKALSKHQLDKDEAFTALADSICNTVGYSLQQTTKLAAETWATVGEEITQYLTEYDVSINQLVSNVGQALKAQLGWSPGRTTLHNAVKFHKMLIIRGDSIEDVTAEFGSWRKICNKYLKEGGGTNKNNAGRDLPSDTTPPPPPSQSYEGYLERPCPICGGGPCEKAHWPTTVGAGAKEDEWIPLCHECHMSQHEAGFVSWFDMYGRKLFKNFIYPAIRRGYETK